MLKDQLFKTRDFGLTTGLSGPKCFLDQACVPQKTRKLLGPESFSGLFSGYFLGSRKVFLKAPGNSPDSKRTFRNFSRVRAWPASGGD